MIKIKFVTIWKSHFFDFLKVSKFHFISRKSQIINYDFEIEIKSPLWKHMRINCALFPTVPCFLKNPYAWFRFKKSFTNVIEKTQTNSCTESTMSGGFVRSGGCGGRGGWKKNICNLTHTLNALRLFMHANWNFRTV